MRVARLGPLLLAAAGLVTVPLGLRAANWIHPSPDVRPTYLPAASGPRERTPFDPDRTSDLARLKPGLVVIGDSMAGTRIDPGLLTRLTGAITAPLLSPGSGPAWWYLAIKNWVVPSGVHPRAVVVFFRDTNLTNVLFRLDAVWILDTAAHDREDDLNAVVARRRSALYRLRRGVEWMYRSEQVRHWVEPAVSQWPARALFEYRRPRAVFLERLNERLGLDHQRPMDAADMQATEDSEADFDAFVDKSTLPLMLREARQAGLTLLLVRVQRRPAGGAPPYQSPALRTYVTKLHTYVEANGARFVDDTGDPAQTLDMYEDGDHLSPDGRRRYTEMFAARLRERLR